MTRMLKIIFYTLLIITLAKPVYKGIKARLEPHTQIGYVAIEGFLSSSDGIVHQLRTLFKEEEVKAIVLKIESPGGASGTSQAIFNEIIELKKEFPKPCIALVENLCTSGAYWIACATDHIIASPVALIGSIGTSFPFRFKLKEFITQYKIGYEETKAGDFKSLTDPFIDTTTAQKALLQELCDNTYQEFITNVAQCRSKLAASNSADWANGKVFIGKSAHKLGMIDELGSLSTAIAWIKAKALVEGKIEWISPEQPSLIEKLIAPKSDIQALESIGQQVAQKIVLYLQEPLHLLT